MDEKMTLSDRLTIDQIEERLMYWEVADKKELPLLLQLRDTMRDNERLREALNTIASWGEGDVVIGSFDEPGSAKLARDALEQPSKHTERNNCSECGWSHPVNECRTQNAEEK